MPRAKLSDPKPRGRMSAYAYFVQTCRAEHKNKHPDENVIFSEFSRKCAERWKTISEKEKQPFFEMADKDKTRYYAEMSNYEGPKGVRGGRRRRQRKDPNAPKRALSAFFWFCSDERQKVREIYPNMGIGEVAKELGLRWSAVSEDVKNLCEERARKDKARYIEAMALYKSGAHAMPKQEHQVSDVHYVQDVDDSDEEEDEDD